MDKVRHLYQRTMTLMQFQPRDIEARFEFRDHNCAVVGVMAGSDALISQRGGVIKVFD